MQTQHLFDSRPYALCFTPASSSSRELNDPVFNVNLLKIDQAAKDRFHQKVLLNLDRLNTSTLDPAEAQPFHFERRAYFSPLLQNHHEPVLKTQWRRAREEKYHAYLSQVDFNVQAFFDDLESQPPLEKIRLTYPF